MNLPPDGMTEALAGGEVDAISIWDVYVYDARKRLGENAVSWHDQNTQDFHWVLMARENVIQSPEPVKRFLKALVKAQDFLLAHEDEAKGIIMRRWGFDPEFMRENWEETRLDVSLSQSLVRSLDNAANWNMHRDGRFAESAEFPELHLHRRPGPGRSEGGHHLQVEPYAREVQDMGEHRRLHGGFGDHRLFCLLHPLRGER